MDPPEIIWIIGGGQFGLRAAEQIRHQKSADATIVMIDRAPIGAGTDHIDIVTDDGVAWLLKNFTRSSRVSKIIPAVPLHLAAYWLLGKLSSGKERYEMQRLPDSMIDHFPNALHTADGSVVMSYADFLCPPDCPEPDKICTHTGLPRRTPLYLHLETINCAPCRKLILQSRQFAPGVGGFYPDDLWNLLSVARELSDTPILTATACKCHGVASLLCRTNDVPSR